MILRIEIENVSNLLARYLARDYKAFDSRMPLDHYVNLFYISLSIQTLKKNGRVSSQRFKLSTALGAIMPIQSAISR